LHPNHILKSGDNLRKEVTTKSSDEYEVLERILIHPMTKVCKMDATFQNMIWIKEETCKVESICKTGDEIDVQHLQICTSVVHLKFKNNIFW
jgi:hypothetical protein